MASSLEISTNMGCVIDCNCCPQKHIPYNSTKFLSINNFKIILDKLPKYLRIKFSGFSEPFINYECIDMIEYALYNNYDIELFTTFFGVSNDIWNRLKKILNSENMKRVVVHLPDINNNMRNFQVSDTYLKIITEIRENKNAFFMTMNNNLEVIDKLKYLNLSLLEWELDTRLGLISSNSKKFFKNIHCHRSEAFEAHLLLPNGDVYMCSSDWKLEYKIGNLYTQTYEEVLNSPLRKHFIQCNRDGSLQNYTRCFICYYAHEK